MVRLQILMPMGGLGTRFAQKGYKLPKPLIRVDGKPMFLKALESFSVLEDLRYLFVVRQDQEEKYQLSKQIKSQLPEALVTFLQRNTRGTVETCLLARDNIQDDLPTIVTDCDIYFQSSEYFNKIQKTTEKGGPDAILLTFTSTSPRYSYVEVNDQGLAVRTAEKVVISNHAILGGYFFRTGKLFKELADEFMAKGLQNNLTEYFMSHLFNILLERGGKVEIADVDKMDIFGTPEELMAYQNRAAK